MIAVGDQALLPVRTFVVTWAKMVGQPAPPCEVFAIVVRGSMPVTLRELRGQSMQRS